MIWLAGSRVRKFGELLPPYPEIGEDAESVP